MNNTDKEDLIESFFDRQLSEEQKQLFRNLYLEDIEFKEKVKEEALFRKVILEAVKEEALEEDIDFEATETDTVAKLWYQKPFYWILGVVAIILICVLWFLYF